MPIDHKEWVQVNHGKRRCPNKNGGIVRLRRLRACGAAQVDEGKAAEVLSCACRPPL